MRIAVVGCGLVGLGTAYALQRMLARADVVVCEKEGRLGAHQSTRNSGVLHAGLYHRPGSAKAFLATGGIRLMSALAQRHAVPREQCGKVVVAAPDKNGTRRWSASARSSSAARRTG
ncbi:MAG: FAD-dependent oxidoreductase, partial [Gemmatimonadetes bacterium]|nr:FAD-dependent oxidoreductase [Gemmatimonadota bacterium]